MSSTTFTETQLVASFSLCQDLALLLKKWSSQCNMGRYLLSTELAAQSTLSFSLARAGTFSQTRCYATDSRSQMTHVVTVIWYALVNSHNKFRCFSVRTATFINEFNNLKKLSPFAAFSQYCK